MARPRKQAADRRTAPVLVKLTTAERAHLVGEVARLRAPSLTALVRERALTGTVTVRAAAKLPAVDRVALTRVGVNLNQIARVLNERGAPAVVEIESELRVMLARINAVLLEDADDDSETL